MQKLTVSGFLGVAHAEVRLDGLTVLIGAQASGKSVVARLFYFFNEYFADFDELALLKNEHKKTYDSRKRIDFYKIFPPYSWQDDAFEICFENGAHSVKIRSEANSSTVELTSSKSVADYFRNLKRSFQSFVADYPDGDTLPQTRMLREFRRMHESLQVEKYERSLFVPAARSFYSTIREEIFSILSLDEKIDRIIMQFGEFYENAKSSIRYVPDRGGRSVTRKVDYSTVEKEYFSKIVKGQYVRVDERDWIEMERGRIELSKASSGQQEAVPLLIALSRFPSPGRTLIIEEPEAHLFPESQVQMLDFIVRQAVSRRTNIMFTTHSPYLLSALNNYILRGFYGMDRSINIDRVNAYSLGGGKTESIIDAETSLISADYIDSVSERIDEEFVSVLGHANV